MKGQTHDLYPRELISHSFRDKSDVKQAGLPVTPKGTFCIWKRRDGVQGTKSACQT